jgi:hypothetical protein
MATSFSGGRSRSTQREPPTMGKQLVNFITCGKYYYFCRFELENMSIYEILPALGLQSVKGKICIVMQLVVRFEISRIPFFVIYKAGRELTPYW